MEHEIWIINKIIRESIIHGGDHGGSYNSNKEKLITAINSWLEIKGLLGEYTIEEIPVGGGYCLYQIIKR